MLNVTVYTLPKVNPAYCEPELVTPAFLEAEYAKLEARRHELDTAKVTIVSLYPAY
jgi:hypothetical protein